MLTKALRRIALVALGLGSLMAHGEVQDSINAPPALEPTIKHLVGDSHTISPNLKRLALNQDRVRTISVLGRAKDPSTICGRVVSEVVDSVDGVISAGSGAEIFKERLEALTPTTTHLNATGSPITKPGAVGVFTTLDHFGPAVVFGASFHGHDYNDCRAAMGRKI